MLRQTELQQKRERRALKRLNLRKLKARVGPIRYQMIKEARADRKDEIKAKRRGEKQ